MLKERLALEGDGIRRATEYATREKEEGKKEDVLKSNMLQEKEEERKKEDVL